MRSPYRKVGLAALGAIAVAGGLALATSKAQRPAPEQEAVLDPWALKLAADGKDLYVACRSANQVVKLSLADGEVTARTPVGESPVDLVLDPLHHRVLVLCQDRFTVESLDDATLAPRGARTVDPFPTAGYLASRGPAGKPALYLTHQHTDEVSALDPGTGAKVTRLLSGRGPSRLLASPDGSLLLAGSYHSLRTDPRKPPVVELTGIDTRRGRVAFRLALEEGGILRGGAFTPDGRVALITLQRSKNCLPNVDVAEGWSMTHGLVVLTRSSPAGAPDGGWQAHQVLIDGLAEGNADPHDVAITPDGKLAFVACLAANRVLALDVEKLLATVSSTPPYDLAHRLDLLDRFRVATISTGPGPRALALSAAGDRLFVALAHAESIGVIDTRTLQVVATHRLAPPRQESLAHRGQRLFHDAHQSLERRLACSSCHPESNHDGLTYDLAIDGLGKNRVRIKTLLDSSGTEPFKWSGLNAGYYAQCGQRAAKIIMHHEGYAAPDLDALVAYLRSLKLPPNPFASPDGSLTPAQARGRALFEREKRKDGTPIAQRDRCASCHSGQRFTNKKSFDVATRAASDTGSSFDTPQLENLFMARPFLHDGRSATVEEVFTLEDPDDKHGVVNDLGKDELNDLMEYLKSLGPRRAPWPVPGGGAS